MTFDKEAEVTQADHNAANKAFDIAFRGETDGIDDAMAELFAKHRLAALEASSRQDLLARTLEVVRACGGAGDDHDTAVWNEAVAEVEKELTRAWPRISGEVQ